MHLEWNRRFQTSGQRKDNKNTGPSSNTNAYQTLTHHKQQLLQRIGFDFLREERSPAEGNLRFYFLVDEEPTPSSNIKSTVQTKAATSGSKLAEFAGNSNNVSSKVTAAEASTFLPSRNPLIMSLRLSLSSKEIYTVASTAFPIKGRLQPPGMLILLLFSPSPSLLLSAQESRQGSNKRAK